MEEKSVTFCFLKLKAKEKADFSNIIWGRVTFLWRIQVSSFKVNVYSLNSAVAMEWWKRKTRDYYQKLTVQAASRIAEQFRTYDLRKWITFMAVYLSFHWFNDSWTGNSWIWTRTLWIWTRNSWIWTRNLCIWTQNSYILTHNSWIWTRNLWIWTRTLSFNLCF